MTNAISPQSLFNCWSSLLIRYLEQNPIFFFPRCARNQANISPLLSLEWISFNTFYRNHIGEGKEDYMKRYCYRYKILWNNGQDFQKNLFEFCHKHGQNCKEHQYVPPFFHPKIKGRRNHDHAIYDCDIRTNQWIHKTEFSRITECDKEDHDACKQGTKEHENIFL